MKLKPVSLFSAPASARATTTAAPLSASSRRALTHEDSVSQRRQVISSSASSSSASSTSNEPTTATTTATTTAAKQASKFHRAAIDGYLDMLCDASKRDTNLRANQIDAITPTLLAAYSGQLEALRILVGRGGDPERTTSSGSSGLHLAAARGHLNCVSFLVNFGVNMWALDNELHTAKDVAAIEQRKEVLNYLDQMMAKQSALNTKTVQKLKERAKVGAEKRLKQMRKAQLKAIKQIERDERYLARLSHNRRLLKSAHSISDIRLVCKSGSSASSQSSSLVGSDISSHPSSSLAASSSPIGSLLAAVSRQSSSSGSSARRFFRPSLNKAPTILLAANHSLLNQSASSAASLSSSSSSSSDELSPLSAATFSPANHQQQATKNNTRPRYSELVAVRKLSQNDSSGEKRQQSSAANHGSNSATTRTITPPTPTSIGSKLTKGLGGVSRKVHLRKFLQVACSTNDLTGANDGATLCEPAEEPEATKKPASIRWPPTLSRTISEPDFGQIIAPRGPPPPPPPAHADPTAFSQGQAPKAEAQRQAQRGAESQHKLLTRCLSQLRMCHEQSSGKQQSDQPGSATTTTANTNRASRMGAGPRQSPKGHSDELLLHHERLDGAANERLIRPSAIKQQLQAKRAPTNAAGELATPAPGSIDSIGSAGRLANRRSELNSILAATNSSSSSSSSTCFSSSSSSSPSAGSYANSSSKTVSCTKRAGSQLATTRQQPRETIDSFLQLSGLCDLGEVFARERIDLEALMLLTEDDLKSLNILLGPRRKLLKAIEDRRGRQTAAAAILSEANLDEKYVMVDTAL